MRSYKALSIVLSWKTIQRFKPKAGFKRKKFVNDFVDKAVVPAVTEASKNLARDYLMKIGKKKLGLDIKDSDQAYMEKLHKQVKKMKLEKDYRDLKNDLNGSVKKEAEKAKEEAKKIKRKRMNVNVRGVQNRTLRLRRSYLLFRLGSFKYI